MSVKSSSSIDGPPLATLDSITSGINWASGHGASVINISLSGCIRGATGCLPSDPAVQLLKQAVDRAYNRGISVVVCAFNTTVSENYYPAAFGQLHADDYWWTYNEKLVMAVSGTISDTRHPNSNYGEFVDFSAPFSKDNGDGILSTFPLSQSGYGRYSGTSMSAPQVAGLASLVTTLGYSNQKIWDYLKSGATDLLTPGYDNETGWGRIEMSRTMSLAARPRDGSNPGMVVVPNAGKPGVQWFNVQGSGFTPNAFMRICVTAPDPGGVSCDTAQRADEWGVAGLSFQPAYGSPLGTWNVTMCEQDDPTHCAQSQTFVTEP
jgi:hypothetical protein